MIPGKKSKRYLLMALCIATGCGVLWMRPPGRVERLTPEGSHGAEPATFAGSSAFVALLSVGFLIVPSILSVFAVIAIVSGGTICWGGSVLAGIVQGNQKAAAVLVLILGIAIASFGFLVMVFAICGGGVSCPARIPAQVVAFPIAFAAFNAMCACLLWWRRTA